MNLTIPRLNLLFLLVWILLLVITYLNSYDDPSSIFYSEAASYQQRYSKTRAREADSFLANPPPKPPPPPSPEDKESKFLCIGIPSINRTTQSFLKHTIGTLLDTLTPEERGGIHLVVLLADRPATKHSAYGEGWLEKVVDEVLVYDDPPASDEGKVYKKVPFELVEGRERGTTRVENMRLDHSLLVEACMNQGAEYFVLVEDDIVAGRDWLERLKRGLGYVEGVSENRGEEWLYLRLFYSELLMGWNSEEWRTYLGWSCAVYATVLIGFLIIRSRRWCCFGKLGRGNADLYRYATAMGFGLWLPALIALYFLSGRVSTSRVNPFTWTSHGVREMMNYGCCAQGLLFPKRQLPGVFKLMRYPPYRFPGDMILEGYAGDHGLKKWALDPSVFQHVGFTESSAGPRRAEVWNFSFERMHPKGWLWGGS
ncbi:putative glycosyltransferase [Triangularia setosa]|uniref:Glycosyltransferase n=1 Tax=Triangularia setosa TaxID=2587417 RepID=A0AAN6WBB1_9PEZI|nr:putative glycosyltransferase [Podospora setosa]